MKVITKIITDPTTYLYEPELLAPDTFFLSLDTTGLLPEESHITILGAGYFKNQAFHTILWLNETGFEDQDVLEAFLRFVDEMHFQTVITYYGRYFAFPFLAQKAESEAFHDSWNQFLNLSHIDLYQTAKTFKDALGLRSCRQKALERRFDIKRSSSLSGKDLVSTYQRLVGLNRPGLCEHFSDAMKKEGIKVKDELIFHARENLCVLTRLSTLFVLQDLREGVIKEAHRVDAQTFAFRMRGAFAGEIALSMHGMALTLEGAEVTLRVPVYAAEEDEEYFYKHPFRHYKDYYYLPMEDRAIHKSLASFVGREYKEKATAATCYEWLSISHKIFDSDAGTTGFVGDCLYAFFHYTD